MNSQVTNSTLTTRSRVVVSLVAIGLGTTLGLCLLSRRVSEATSRAALEIVPGALDFGEVWDQRNFRWTLPIRNTSDEPVEVLEFKTSCGCLSVEPESFVVRPGETVTAKLLLNLNAKSQQEASLAIREFDVEIVPVTKGSLPGRTRWELRGQVHRYPLVASPPSVDFGERLVLGSLCPSRTVGIECLVPTVDMKAECDESIASVYVEHIGDDPQSYQVQITLRPDLELGKHEFWVSLKPTIDPAELPLLVEAPPEWQLAVVANVTRDVYVSPSRIVFGVVRVGETVEGMVILCSTNNRPFVAEVAKSDGCSVQPEVAAKNAKGIHWFRVSQTAVTAGNQRAEVRFVIRQGKNEQPYEITLPVSYYGMAEQK